MDYSSREKAVTHVIMTSYVRMESRFSLPVLTVWVAVLWEWFDAIIELLTHGQGIEAATHGSAASSSSSATPPKPSVSSSISGISSMSGISPISSSAGRKHQRTADVNNRWISRTGAGQTFDRQLLHRRQVVRRKPSVPGGRGRLEVRNVLRDGRAGAIVCYEVIDEILRTEVCSRRTQSTKR